MRRVVEPVKIGNPELKNRLVRSVTREGIARPDGSMTEQAYTIIYEELAKGGAGAVMMVVGGFRGRDKA